MTARVSHTISPNTSPAPSHSAVTSPLPQPCRHVSAEYFLCGLPCGTRFLLCPACYDALQKKAVSVDSEVSNLDSREVKRHCDFIAIASRYTRLRHAGRQWRGLCPFHRESRPSLYIEPQQKIWKCFGCERGGDVFDFVMLAESCDFQAALGIVAGVAEGSAPRGARFDRGEGAQPLARAAGAEHRPDFHTPILTRLNETERRCKAIVRANAESFAEFERPCEPHDDQRVRSGEQSECAHQIYTLGNNFQRGE